MGRAGTGHGGSLLTLALSACLAAAEPTAESVKAAYLKDIRPLLATYCIDCHGDEVTKAGVNFARHQAGEKVLGAKGLWKSTFTKVNGLSMPPEDEKQPSAAERQRLLDWLRTVKHLEQPDPGVTVIRRLSRVEFTNTIKDLFGPGVVLNADLPLDRPGEGFANAVSPLLMEKYLIAADDLLDRAISAEQVQRRFTAGQMDALKSGAPDPGTPEGKERRFAEPGEVFAIVDIPNEGSYTVKVRAAAEQAGREPVRLGVRFDSQVVSELKVTAKPSSPGTYTCTIRLLPGRTRLAVTFMNPLVEGQAAAPANPNAKKDEPTVRAAIIESVDLVGPPGQMPTPVQGRIFVAMPGKDLAKRDAARRIIEPFALRAFRRPPTADEVDILLKVFDLADGQDEGFAGSIKLVLKAVLISPQFLYRTPEATPPGTLGIVKVGDYEMASRLSYFLWATMPDEELFTLAREGRLRDPAVIEAQVRRLIKDPRSRALAENFAAPWLGLHQVANAVVDEKQFPMVTKAVRQAMYEEGVVFFDRLLRDGGNMLDLLDCDYAYMNAATAKFYGVDSVKGAAMEKVALTDRNRGGLIGMPGVLLVTSRFDRTSPVLRGKWVLDTLFNAGPPPAPPDVAPLEKQNTVENAKLSLRQKTQMHRTMVACASCHRVMDPLGFGLENFDPVGRWRTRDEHGIAVDSLGELPSGQRFSSPRELKKILVDRKEDFVRALTGKLLAFALGRSLTDYDEVVVDQLAAEAARNRYELDELVVRLVLSYPFTNRRAFD